MLTAYIYLLPNPPYIHNRPKLSRHPNTHRPHSYRTHTMLACDAEGLRVDLAAAAVSALGSWISSGITAPVDGSCCIKFRHASTYLVKMKTATKKKIKREKQTGLSRILHKLRSESSYDDLRADCTRLATVQVLGVFKSMCMQRHA